MDKQTIFDAVQQIFRDNFDDEELVITRETCADDIEDWDSLEQINLLTAMEKKFGIKFQLATCATCPMWATAGSDRADDRLRRTE